jgi:hypothetical protein
LLHLATVATTCHIYSESIGPRNGARIEDFPVKDASKTLGRHLSKRYLPPEDAAQPALIIQRNHPESCIDR